MFLNGITVLLTFLQASAFNLDTTNPIVYVDPAKANNSTYSSYFGYTVVLYPGSKEKPQKWIKIGAPRGMDPTFIKYINSGVVYDCPFMRECKPVDLYKGSYEEKQSLASAWIGGSMDINYKFDRMSICAFRMKRTVYKDYQTVGACYLSDVGDSFQKVTPLKNNATYNNQVYYYGQGQAGFSTHFPTPAHISTGCPQDVLWISDILWTFMGRLMDNNENVLLLGAPGVFNWAGTIVKVTDIEYDDPIASRLGSPRGKRGLQRYVNVADPIGTTVAFAFDLFGYAVTSGYFYGKTRLYYVASTPKSHSYRGKVVIFQFNQDKPVIVKESKIGSQFAEYFGASVAAGDINNDGYDDLIVGAPFHAFNTYNEGRVYIFLGRKQGQLTEFGTLYGGQKTNGQFGSAVMFLGDINRDGYGDIAIGAPYEEEMSGVLYIYKGNSQGLDKQYCQRIVGKEISSEIRGFGISISRPADVDENGYKDIAVGAHLSANAVLLRTKPIIVMGYKMTPIPKQLKRESKTFLLQACYWYSPIFTERSIDINRTITVDEVMGRATIGNQQNKIVKVYKETNTCENITVSIKNSVNYDAPITISLSYKLATPPQKREVMYISDKILTGNDEFCVRCPILDEFRSARASTINVPFTLDCGDDNICQAKLRIAAEIPGLGSENTFVVGSRDYVNLKATVKNTGEKAYSTQLEVVLPNVINFRQIPPACNEYNISVIICNVDNPLRENAEKTINLDLDMKNLNKNNYLSELNVYLRVITTSNNSNKDSISLKFKMAREADITIYGKSEEQSCPFGNITYGMPNFTQLFQVEKMGVSPLEKVLVSIAIPHSILVKDEQISFLRLFPPEGIFAGQPVVCRSNFSYILESKSAETSEKLGSDATFSRRRRQVEVFKNQTTARKEDIKIGDKEYDIVPNRTFFINCSKEDVVCSNIVCSLGPFVRRQTPAVIEIKMMFNSTAISGLIGAKDMVLFSTHGSVTIKDPSGFIQSGDRPDSVEVSSLFISEITKKKKVAVWIIIVSVIVGIILLALIIYGLTKAGFFKRAKKEELKNLKAAAEQQNEYNVIESCEDPFEQTMNSSDEGLIEECEQK